MKPAKKATRTVTLDAAPPHDLAPEAADYPDDQHPDYDPAAEAALCPVCHDLLAWHEQACGPAPKPPVAAEPAADTPALPATAQVHAFAFAIGHRVQPAHSSPAPVVWRGQHKERHPDTGLVHRINVYRLDNGYWDCYREDELQTA